MSLKDIEMHNALRKKDHESLDQDIAEWREWWSELREIGRPHFGEMGDRLAYVREHLTAHVAQEENEGLLSVVVGADREVVLRIAKLRDEHGELLADLDRIIVRLQCCEPPFDCWGMARAEFEDFLDRLNTHEEAEDALFQELPDETESVRR